MTALDRRGDPARVHQRRAGRGAVDGGPGRLRRGRRRLRGADDGGRHHGGGPPPSYFDGVWVSDLLEHLLSQEQTAAFLERMHGAMSPGGRIAIMGPNFRYCVKEYFDCADHTLVYTHTAIAEHLYAAGFAPERIVPRFLPYSFRGRLPATAATTRLYLRTPALWPVLGKQFLVIGRRPA